MISVCSIIHSKQRQGMPHSGTQPKHAEVFWNVPLPSVKFSLQPHRKKPILSIVVGKAFVSFYVLGVKTLGGIDGALTGFMLR